MCVANGLTTRNSQHYSKNRSTKVIQWILDAKLLYPTFNAAASALSLLKLEHLCASSFMKFQLFAALEQLRLRRALQIHHVLSLCFVDATNSPTLLIALPALLYYGYRFCYQRNTSAGATILCHVDPSRCSTYLRKPENRTIPFQLTIYISSECTNSALSSPRSETLPPP